MMANRRISGNILLFCYFSHLNRKLHRGGERVGEKRKGKKVERQSEDCEEEF